MSSDPVTQHVAPFLRWPGGKRILAPLITAHFPQTFSRYHEPFLGSGALFFRLLPKRSYLSDLNPEVVNAFTVVRDNVEELITWLSEQKQTKQHFEAVKKLPPSDPLEQAGRFIFLNRTSFNGIWRVNQSGQFNVPYGRRKRRELVDPDGLRLASRALAGTKLLCSDFESSLKRARRGDLVYADPPYTVKHDNNGFRKYNQVLFSWEDQEKLAEKLGELVSKGVSVAVSNALSADLTALYPGFSRLILKRPSTIAASSSARGEVREGLYLSPDLANSTNGSRGPRG